jgi:hypothetical protein
MLKRKTVNKEMDMKNNWGQLKVTLGTRTALSV